MSANQKSSVANVNWPKSLTYIVWVWILFFVVLMGLTLFWPTGHAKEAASKYFTSQEIEIGQRYARQRTILMWGAWLTQVGFYAWLVLTGWGRRLADRVQLALGRRWLLAVVSVGVICIAVEAILWLPFSFARLELSRSWGMTDRAVVDWLRDFGVRFLVSLVIQLIVLIGLFLLIRWSPRMWWAVAALAGTGLGFAFAYLLPIMISPLFNTFMPIENSQWAHLQKPVNQLAKRAGLKVDGIYVMDASSRGRHSNAYFTGFGSSQRIVLYDTLLTSHTRPSPATVSSWIGMAAIPVAREPVTPLPLILAHRMNGEREIETIIAHEIGHWQHRHIVIGICLAGAGAFAGFFVLAKILRWAVNRHPFNLKSPSDPAAVPLMWLLFILGAWLAMPVQNAISRHFERQADWAALELTERPQIYLEAEKRIVRENLGNVAPNPISVWFFATHPPAVERIEMGEQWRRMHAK